MNFPTIIFVSYLLLCLAGLSLLWRWLLAYLSAREIAPEKRSLISLLAISLLAFIGTLYAFKLNDWRKAKLSELTPSTLSTHSTTLAAPAEPEDMVGEPPAQQPQQPLNDMQRLELFEQQNYPELHEQRIALLQDIRTLDQFFQAANQLAHHTPKQIPLLRGIYQIRQTTRQQLAQRYRALGEQLLNFWVHYGINANDALQKFDPTAEQMVKTIREIRGDSLDNQRKEEKLISDYTRKADALLKNHKLPNTSDGLRAYTHANRQTLLTWLQQRGSIEASGNLGLLAERQDYIRQRVSQIKQYQQAYPNLKTSLSHTLSLWEQALAHTLYAEYRLLYALEIAYVLEQLQINAATIPLKRLDTALDNQLPLIMDYVNDALERAEAAYSPKAGI